MTLHKLFPLAVLLALAGCGAGQITDGALDEDAAPDDLRRRCGDGVCSRSETCSSCARDCGRCAAPTPVEPPSAPSAPVDAGTTPDAAPPTTPTTPGTPAPSVRAVSSPEVVLAGNELDLAKQYYLFNQDPQGSISVVPDPQGTLGNVIRLREMKLQSNWNHVMLNPNDKRAGYAKAAQLTTYGKSYHYKQKFRVTADAQWASIGEAVFLEDFHCEPCEANNIQVTVGNRGDDTLCVRVVYSTNASFDPRGTSRGGADPYPTLVDNIVNANVAADGTAMLPATMPQTGMVYLCRDDVKVSTLANRWVDFEMLVHPASDATGVLRMWIDGKPYFYLGPNDYRWNETKGGAPANNFQHGLYMQPGVQPKAGTAAYFELHVTPASLEIGTNVLYTP